MHPRACVCVHGVVRDCTSYLISASYALAIITLSLLSYRISEFLILSGVVNFDGWMSCLSLSAVYFR